MRACSPLVLPVALGLLASLACIGDPPSCDSGQTLRGTTCVADSGGPLADADTDTDSDSDTDTDSDSDTDTDTDTDADTDTGSSDTVSAYDVQAGGVTGDIVLADVIVTTGVSSDESFFVQDVGGGEWAGLRVYASGLSPSVEPGDRVTVTGLAQEYYDETEVVAADVAVTGSGKVTVTTLSSPPADWEPYEGVLVKLKNIGVTGTVDSYGQTQTDWGLPLDDYLFDYTAITAGTSDFTSITGVTHWAFEEEKLCPRSADDFAY